MSHLRQNNCFSRAKWSYFPLNLPLKVKCVNCLQRGKVYNCGSIWGRMNLLQPILGMGDENLKTLFQLFVRTSDMGPFFKWAGKFPCRHWRLRNFIEQRHVEWATLGKTTVSALQIVLLSKECGAEGQMCQFFSEGESVRLWPYLRKDESSETYPGDKKANLKTCLERFDLRFRWHEIQTSDMGPFFKWKTACGMSRLHDCFSWAQIKSTQHHGIAQFFVST